MMRFVRIGTLAAAIAAMPATAWASAPSAGCELHVWTTANYNAVFHGAAPSGMFLNLSFTPINGLAGLVARDLDSDAQRRIVTDYVSSYGGPFASYELVFHQGVGLGKYPNWIAKGVGEGGRDSASNSSCYAELHIMFVTLFRTAISKKIQTAFMYREFGASQVMTRKFLDAGSTGAPAFPAQTEAELEPARLSLQAAFRKNVEIFLRKRRVQPLIGPAK